jgi:hypothetical protein
MTCLGCGVTVSSLRIVGTGGSSDAWDSRIGRPGGPRRCSLCTCRSTGGLRRGGPGVGLRGRCSTFRGVRGSDRTARMEAWCRRACGQGRNVGAAFPRQGTPSDKRQVRRLGVGIQPRFCRYPGRGLSVSGLWMPTPECRDPDPWIPTPECRHPPMAGSRISAPEPGACSCSPPEPDQQFWRLGGLAPRARRCASMRRRAPRGCGPIAPRLDGSACQPFQRWRSARGTLARTACALEVLATPREPHPRVGHSSWSNAASADGRDAFLGGWLQAKMVRSVWRRRGGPGLRVRLSSFRRACHAAPPDP